MARTSFDASLAPYGDIGAGASAVDKSVGETWSDPAVSQIQTSDSDWVALVGSGFLPRSRELAANRAGAKAGTTFYLLKVEDGTVYIASTDGVGAKIAQERIAGLGENAVIGNICTGRSCASRTSAPSWKFSPAWTGSSTSHNWLLNA